MDICPTGENKAWPTPTLWQEHVAIFVTAMQSRPRRLTCTWPLSLFISSRSLWTRERETLPWPLLGTLIRTLEAKKTNSVPWTEICPFTFFLKPSCELTPHNKRCNYTSCRGHRPAGHLPVPLVFASCINKRETQILIRVLLFRSERRMLCSEQLIPRTNFVLEWASCNTEVCGKNWDLMEVVWIFAYAFQ